MRTMCEGALSARHGRADRGVVPVLVPEDVGAAVAVDVAETGPVRRAPAGEGLRGCGKAVAGRARELEHAVAVPHEIRATIAVDVAGERECGLRAAGDPRWCECERSAG